jgi:DNA mismatch repair protein MutH
MKHYDETNKKSILAYARKLDNKSINQVIDNNKNRILNDNSGTYSDELNTKSMSSISNESTPTYGSKSKENKIYRGKGRFGNFLEEVYFNKKNDNKSQKDFPKADVELKVSPLKFLKDGQVRVKERLVLNHFTFSDIASETFETSHFLEKDSFILLVFYFHDNKKELGNLKIDFSDFWECLNEDKAQIQDDWQTIVNKVKEGKAHELSEGDTLFLGACTKGATKASSMQDQPYCTIKASGRALCFKTNYINQIYKILKSRNSNKPLISPHLFSDEKISFKQQILNSYRPYIGLNEEQICNKLEIPYKNKAKSFYASLTHKILGLKKSTKNIFEFEASGLQLKSVRVSPTGTIKESMSFPALNYCEILKEKWEDSTFYNQITSQFIFVVFKQFEKDGIYYLNNVFFWNVPEKDLQTIHEVWKDTKNKIALGKYDQFIKASNKKISHIRPHDTKGSKPMPTPQGKGNERSRVSFWLNGQYIKRIINQNIK